jgi:hypothetical protein
VTQRADWEICATWVPWQRPTQQVQTYLTHALYHGSGTQKSAGYARGALKGSKEYYRRNGIQEVSGSWVAQAWLVGASGERSFG